MPPIVVAQDRVGAKGRPQDRQGITPGARGHDAADHPVAAVEVAEQDNEIWIEGVCGQRDPAHALGRHEWLACVQVGDSSDAQCDTVRPALGDDPVPRDARRQHRLDADRVGTDGGWRKREGARAQKQLATVQHPPPPSGPSDRSGGLWFVAQERRQLTLDLGGFCGIGLVDEAQRGGHGGDADLAVKTGLQVAGVPLRWNGLVVGVIVDHGSGFLGTRQAGQAMRLVNETLTVPSRVE